MVYNMTNVTAANDLYGIVTATNELTGQVFASLLLFILLVTFMVVYKGNSFKKVFLAGSFFVTLITILFFILGWVGLSVLTTMVFLLFVALMSYLLTQ